MEFHIKRLIFIKIVIKYIYQYKEVFIMAYVISDECIACGACAAECPCEAISEGEGKFDINADACVECGACADVCPVGAPKKG